MLYYFKGNEIVHKLVVDTTLRIDVISVTKILSIRHERVHGNSTYAQTTIRSV